MATLDIVVRAQNQASAALNQLKGQLSGINKEAGFAQRGFSGLQNAVGSGLVLAAGAGVAAIGGIAAGLAAGTSEFASFQKGMNEVFTLLPGISANAMREMEGDVKSFATEFKTLPETVVPALYQALSAGVPPDNVFDFLGTAQKAAVGGVTDLTTAVDGISSVVNAYGAEVLSSARASDVMFTAVRLGKTNFEQLSSSLFNVIPAAASMGVSFEDVSAGLARLTAQGTPTSVATTQLRQLFIEASKDTSTLGKAINEVAGESFTSLIAKGLSSAEILQMVRASMPDDEFRNLFGSVEAAGAALGITGPQYEAFVSTLDEMNDSAGATDAAFETMDRGLSRVVDQFKAFGQTALIEIGQRVAPYLERLGNTVGTMLPVAMTALTTSLDTVTSFIDVLLGKDITPFADAMRSAFGRDMGNAISDVAVALSVVGETLSSGSLDYLQGFMDEVGFGVPVLNGMAQAVLTLAPALSAMIAPVVSLVGEFVSWKDVLGAVAIVIASIVLPALLGMVVAAAKVIAIFAGLVAGVAALRSAWESDFAGLRTNTLAAFDGLTTGIQSAWDALVEFFGPSIERLVGAFQGFIDKLAPLPTEMGNLGAAFGSLGQALQPIVELVGVLLANAFQILLAVIEAVMENASTHVLNFVSTFTAQITAAAEVISGWVELIKAIIAGDYTAAWEAAGQIAQGYVDFAVATFNGMKTTIEMIFSTMASAVNNTIENMRLGAAIDFQRIKNAVTTATDNARSAVVTAWENGRATLTGIWTGIQSAASSAFNGIRSAMDTIISAKDSIVGAFTSLRDFIAGLSIPNPFSGITSSLQGIIDLANRAKNALGGVGGSGNSSAASNAAGTSYFRGGMTTINERGTELIALPGRNRQAWLPRGTAIYPAEQSPMLMGAGGGVTVNVYATVNNGMDAESLAHTIAGIMRRNQR